MGDAGAGKPYRELVPWRSVSKGDAYQLALLKNVIAYEAHVAPMGTSEVRWDMVRNSMWADPLFQPYQKSSSKNLKNILNGTLRNIG